MKITKLIREYIEEEVGKVYNAKINPYSEQAEKDRQLIKEFKEYYARLKETCVEEFLAKNPMFGNFGDDPIKASPDPSFYRWRTQSMVKEDKWKQENIRLKEAKIREIKLALELGATREDLNKMIADLKGE